MRRSEPLHGVTRVELQLNETPNAQFYAKEIETLIASLWLFVKVAKINKKHILTSRKTEFEEQEMVIKCDSLDQKCRECSIQNSSILTHSVCVSVVLLFFVSWLRQHKKWANACVLHPLPNNK